MTRALRQINNTGIFDVTYIDIPDKGGGTSSNHTIITVNGMRYRVSKNRVKEFMASKKTDQTRNVVVHKPIPASRFLDTSHEASKQAIERKRRMAKRRYEEDDK